jgi:hypothetical protein
VSGLPLTVIRAPAMGSTTLTWLSFRSLDRSAEVTPPGTAAMTSGTTRRGTDAPAADLCCAPAGTVELAGTAVLGWPGSPPFVLALVLVLVPGTGRFSIAGLLDLVRPAAPAAAAPAAGAGVRAVPWTAPRGAAPLACPGPPLSAATQPAATALTATSPPPTTAGHDPRRMLGCLTLP